MEKLLVSTFPLSIYIKPEEGAIPFTTAERGVILHPALDNNGKIIIKNNFCAIRAEGRIGWTYIDNVTELTEKMSRGDFIWEKKP